jgi:hypothetical protein
MPDPFGSSPCGSSLHPSIARTNLKKEAFRMGFFDRVRGLKAVRIKESVNLSEKCSIFPDRGLDQVYLEPADTGLASIICIVIY